MRGTLKIIPGVLWLLGLAACPSQLDDYPCPAFANPGPLASGQTTWGLSDGVSVDELLATDVATPCAARISVSKSSADFSPEPVEGDNPALVFGFSVSCELAPDMRRASIGFGLPDDIRTFTEGSTHTMSLVPSLDYGPGEGQVCRWNGLPVYSSATPPPEGEIILEVLSVTGGVAPYTDFVSDDFRMQVRLTHTSQNPLVGYQQIDGQQVACPRTIDTFSFDLVFELTPEMFEYDSTRMCSQQG